MPIITSKPLKNVVHLRNTVRYLGDQAHPKHRFHEIAKVQTLDGTHIEKFFDGCLALTAAYNSVVETRHQVRTPATSYFFTFPSGSRLTTGEKTLFAADCAKFLCWDGLGVEAWHVNAITGGADYNLVVPTIAMDTVPVPRKTRSENTMAALRRKCDELLAKINEQRAQDGFPQIRTVEECQIANPARFSFERELAAVAKARGHVKVENEHLPVLLEAIGMSWEIDFQLRISVSRRRRKPKHDEEQRRDCGLKRRMADVLRVVNIFLGLLWLENNKNNKTYKPDKELYESKDKEKNEDVGGNIKSIALPRPPDPDIGGTEKSSTPPPQV